VASSLYSDITSVKVELEFHNGKNKYFYPRAPASASDDNSELKYSNRINDREENFLLISIFLWALSLCFNSKYGFKVGDVFCNSDAETLLFFVASGVRRKLRYVWSKFV
jgi:hypothetical protein